MYCVDVKTHDCNNTSLFQIAYKTFKSKNSMVELGKTICDEDELYEEMEGYGDLNILTAVQLLLPKTDSKEFVDRPTRKPIQDIISSFIKLEESLGFTRSTPSEQKTNFIKNIMSIISQEPDVMLEDVDFLNLWAKSGEKAVIIKEFIQENYKDFGSDIMPYIPKDYTDNPKFLSKLKNEKIKELGKEINKGWRDLCRIKVELDKNTYTSFFDIPCPFVVPGGRFREPYYWDSYWILDGLLICDMNEMAENVVRNFISVINTYGYIPNGFRKYYLNRSQPPFFTLMLLLLLRKDQQYENLVLNEGLEAAIIEYEFFNKNRKIQLRASNGKQYELCIYRVSSNFPRPESFSEDVISWIEGRSSKNQAVYTHLKSAAESGWDFSSRWFLDPTDIRTCVCGDIIPTDLNSVLYAVERGLQSLCEIKNDMERAIFYQQKADHRAEAINQILWDKDTWRDFNLVTGKFVNHRFYFSNVTPMIYGVKCPEGNHYDLLKKYMRELFSYPGGIPASGDGVDTKQQWDFPNVWAPNQEMLASWLKQIGEYDMALHVARSFFLSVMNGFEGTGFFHEKYNCLIPGFSGMGGEYAPQIGFGWTNGTILRFIKDYGDDLLTDVEHSHSYEKIIIKLSEEISKKNVE